MSLRRASLAVLAAVAALAAVLVSESAPTSGSDSGVCASGAGTTTLTINSGGRQRVASVHTPPGLRAPAPLLLAFHGGGQSALQMERSYGLSTLADGAGFMVAYPSATGPHKYWNVGTTHDSRTADDVAFTDALVDRLLIGGCVDPRRVSAVGMSNGGGFAARFGCMRPGRLAAVVTVEATYGSLPPCRPARPLSVLAIHGTADAAVPYSGRPQDGRRGAVSRWLSLWVRRDGCSPKALSHAAGKVIRFDWPGCRGGTTVSHLKLIGGEHAWPGAVPVAEGPVIPISGAAETWRFVAPRRGSGEPTGGISAGS